MPVEGVRRPAWAEISASAIAHNVAALRDVLGATQFCAVVKANGYGHGALLAAKAALQGGADSLAVAIVDEGIELRNAGISAPILLLAEIPADTVADALSHSLTLTIGSLAGARAAAASAKQLGGRHRVHVKLDTGMHRMGVAPEGLDEVVDVLLGAPELDFEGLYTHFSVADGSSASDRSFTRAQIERFDEALAALAARGVHPRVLHTANSAGALGYPEARRSMVRVGLALYGYLPNAWLVGALDARHVQLRPALTLRAQVVAVRRVRAGERPSYGRQRPLERDAWIATVPFGYADGYPRRLFGAGAEVLIGSRRYPLAGTVTMDQLLIDCGDDEVGVGDDVVLLGPQGDETITADEWAERAQTITWEILCGIGARVPRVLVD
ncbi:MAG: alanine racemase [Actinobacteria bacterium 21-64-8]|nr:MAG: alanine racemase [Actinobacteria bacterium 21-64-8]